MKTPQCFCHSLVKLFACAAILAGTAKLHAQPSSDSLSNFWRTDGPVHAIAINNRTAYIGGEFSYVGPANGAAGLLDADFGDPLPGFPKLNGTINAVIPDGAGGWYVGGDFKPAENDKLLNLIHVLRGNVIDSNFRPNPAQPVRTLLLAGGALLVGGDFSQIAGIQTGNLAFLDPQSGKTNGIRTRVQGAVYTMAAEGDTVYVGGAFRSITTFVGNQQSSVQRGRLAAVNPSTGDVLPWNPNSTGGQGVYALAIGPNGIYAGGDFTQCGGRPRNAIALLNKTDGAAASTWNPNAILAGGSPSVNALAVVGNVVYAGGQFTTIGARAKTRLAALQAGGFGQADANWQADANDVVNFIVPSGTDILVGGAFNVIGGRIETINSQTIQTGGTPRGGFARVAQANGAVSDWGPQVSLLRPIQAIGAKAVASALGMQGSQMLLGGNFISFGGLSRPRLAAIDLDTGVATDWNPAPDFTVRALAIGHSGLYVGGLFTNIGGLTRPRIALVKFDTGSANDWDARFAQGQGVFSIAANQNNVFVGGQFNKIGGQDRSNLAQLNAQTGDATEWRPDPGGSVDALVLTDNNIYAAGQFKGIAGSSQQSYLALLTFDPRPAEILVKTFDAKIDARVRTLGLDGDRLYVGGDFTKISGQDRNRVAAVDAATGVEKDPWDAQITGRGQLQIRALIPVGKSVYLGGQFSGAGGDNRARGASVHSVFGAATGWDPGADQAINAMARTGDLILIGGEFTRLKMRGPNADQGVGAEPVPYFAAFNSLPSIENFGKNAQGRYAFKVLDGDGLGTTLQVQSTDSLTPPAWQTLKTLDVLGIQDPYEDTTVAPGGTRIYRLVRQP